MLMRAYRTAPYACEDIASTSPLQLARSAGMHYRTMIALQTEPLWHERELQKSLASIEIP